MKQTKKKWAKGIQILNNPTKRRGHLYYLYRFLPSVIFPTANQLISNWDILFNDGYFNLQLKRSLQCKILAAHTCHPSYFVGWVQEDHGLRAPCTNTSGDLSLNNYRTVSLRYVSSDRGVSEREVLCWNTHPNKKKTQKRDLYLSYEFAKLFYLAHKVHKDCDVTHFHPITQPSST
jgi:hypothetical protein